MAKSSDCTMEWQSYWGWLSSDIPGTKEKLETMRYFIESNILGGMSDSGVMECLEFAPEYVIKVLIQKKQIPNHLVCKFQKHGESATTRSVSWEGTPWTSQEDYDKVSKNPSLFRQRLKEHCGRFR